LDLVEKKKEEKKTSKENKQRYKETEGESILNRAAEQEPPYNILHDTTIRVSTTIVEYM
jgi:hypothetical protein